MKITVLIPTYCRHEDLERCLIALQGQVRLADEVLVMVRDIDKETQDFLESFESAVLKLSIIHVTIPGQVAALNVGLNAAQGDIIAISDDDAAPHLDWLAKIEEHFLLDPSVGAVGGRDWIYFDGVLEDNHDQDSKRSVIIISGKVNFRKLTFSREPI
jgi:cellulose synthase/poly-beta-1,6-N-acetylglucosamine synthase-like glycosyltransferase